MSLPITVTGTTGSPYPPLPPANGITVAQAEALAAELIAAQAASDSGTYVPWDLALTGYADDTLDNVFDLAVPDLDAVTFIQDVVGDLVGLYEPGPGGPPQTQAKIAVLDPATGRLDPDYIPPGAASAFRVLATVGTGLVVPAWGRAPGFAQVVGECRFTGQLASGTTDLIAGTVLLTAGPWTASGVPATALTDSGVVLLRSGLGTLLLDSILSGDAPLWVSLDGVTV